MTGLELEAFSTITGTSTIGLSSVIMAGAGWVSAGSAIMGLSSAITGTSVIMGLSAVIMAGVGWVSTGSAIMGFSSATMAGVGWVSAGSAITGTSTIGLSSAIMAGVGWVSVIMAGAGWVSAGSAIMDLSAVIMAGAGWVSAGSAIMGLSSAIMAGVGWVSVIMAGVGWVSVITGTSVIMDLSSATMAGVGWVSAGSGIVLEIEEVRKFSKGLKDMNLNRELEGTQHTHSCVDMTTGIVIASSRNGLVLPDIAACGSQTHARQTQKKSAQQRQERIIGGRWLLRGRISQTRARGHLAEKAVLPRKIQTTESHIYAVQNNASRHLDPHSLNKPASIITKGPCGMISKSFRVTRQDEILFEILDACKSDDDERSAETCPRNHDTIVLTQSRRWEDSLCAVGPSHIAHHRAQPHVACNAA
jgi:hypothetical protein